MLPTAGDKPVVLLLGEVVIAQAEWNALRAIAELRVCISTWEICHSNTDGILATQPWYTAAISRRVQKRRL